MRIYFVLIAAGCAFAAMCGTALSYDGSWYLFKLLDLQSPHVPVHRCINIFLHWPVIWASYYTSNLRLLGILFSLIYTSFTLIALLASWWIVRKDHRHLFVWVAAGLGLGLLPGWIFAVGESMIAIPLFWPILLAVAIGMPRRAVLIVVLAAIVIFLAHPVALGYFLLAAGLAFFVGYRSPDGSRRMYAWGIGFLVLFAAKCVLFFALRSPYESGELSLRMQLQHFRASAAGLPLIALSAAWLAAALLALRMSRPVATCSRLVAVARPLELLCLGIAGGLILFWARDPRSWRSALDFRDLAVFSSAPFMALAAFEALWGASILLGSETEWNHRVMLTQIVGISFLVVIAVQSSEWLMMRQRLQFTMAESERSCISAQSLRWLDGTALYHWSTPVYAVLVQGRKPEKLVLFDKDCADPTFSDRVHIKYSEYRSRSGGWFDFSRAGLEGAKCDRNQDRTAGVVVLPAQARAQASHYDKQSE